MPEIMVAVNRGCKVVRLPVEAELFDVDGLELAVHPALEQKGLWAVSDPQTGRYIRDRVTTREGAIELATEKIREKGVEQWREIIAKNLAKDQAAKPIPEPKGELVGIDALKLWAIYKLAGDRVDDALLAVALAAQRAFAGYIGQDELGVYNRLEIARAKLKGAP